MILTEGRRAMLRHIVDGAPAVVFLAVLLITRDFRLATWFVVGGAVAALFVSLAVDRRFRPLPTITAAMALIFGGASLLLRRADILQMKMTIVDGLLGAILFGGLIVKRNPLKALLGSAFRLSDRAWAILAMRYGAFWWASAVANEIVRNTQSQTTWAAFRVAALVAAVVFALAQAPFLIRHGQPPGEAASLDPPEAGP